jgi:hypothetical protein
MKKALVTLTIGDRYIANYKRFCHDSWNKYAQKHNLDLVVIASMIDDSLRAQSRSPAWQKCLILSHEDVKKYDQVAWVDSDILINPTSPSVFEDVPIEMIGAVDCWATPNWEDHRIWLERTYEYWSKNGVKFVNNISATDYYKNFGLEGEFQSVVQTGVLVLSPKYHNELLEHVYNNYEDKGEASWNYEMRPLSYEILTNKMARWLNHKFNMGWIDIKQNLYPFLNTSDSYIHRAMNKMLRTIGLPPKSSLATKCATTAFLNNYFLHFASCADEMIYVNQKITSIFEIWSS